MRIYLLFTASILSLSLKAQLSGNYTINSSGSGSANFNSFNAAVDSLMTVGVSGTVTFNVAPGIYTEQINIPAIAGSSANNRIIFQSATLDSSDVVLDHPSSASAGNNFTIYLNGADYITFRNLSITRSGTGSYGRAVHISGGANYNVFENNYLSGTYYGFGLYAALIYSPGSDDNFNHYSSNYFFRASMPFLLNGSSAEEGTVIENNVSDSMKSGVYITHQKSPFVRNNTIRILYSSNSCEGIALHQCSGSAEITGNRIYSHSGGNGIYLAESWSDSLQPGLIVNNTVYGSNPGDLTGISIYKSRYWNLYHNNIYVLNSIYDRNPGLNIWSNSSEISLSNNIFANSGIGFVVYADPGSILSSVKNNFYAGTDSVIHYGTGYATLDEWRAAYPIDTQSVSINPVFKVPDLLTRNIILNDQGIQLAAVPKDIEGKSRDNTPDIGAYEFDPYSNDVRLERFGGNTDACRDTSEIRLVISNNGLSNIDSMRFHLTISGTSVFDSVLQLSLLPGRDTNFFVTRIGIWGASSFLRVEAFDAGGASDPDSSDNRLFTTYYNRMAGDYYLGGPNANFGGGLSPFVDMLKARGVCGPVVLHVADGVYNAKVTIPGIYGMSAVNTVTIRGMSKDSSKAVFSGSPGSFSSALVSLSGADHFHFEHVGFEHTGTSGSSSLINISQQAGYNTFSNCRFRPRGTSVRASVEANSYNRYLNNHFSTGTGIDLTASSSGEGTIIEGNIFDSMGSSILLQNQSDVMIRNNLITNSASGITLESCSSFQISGNRMLGMRSFAIKLVDCHPGAAPSLISNNLIRLKFTNNVDGIIMQRSSSQEIVHNSILIEMHNTTTNSCISLDANCGPGNRLQNNILTNLNQGQVIKDLSGKLQHSDFNALYTNGPIFATYLTPQTDFTEWNTITKLDHNSVARNPLFSPLMVPRSGYLNNKAIAFASVTTDINGTTRASQPDPGALEFSVDSFVVVRSFLPESLCEDSSAQSVVVIENLGSTTQSGMVVQGSVTGGGSFSFTSNSALLPGQTDTLHIPQPFNSFGLDSVLLDIQLLHTLPDGMNDSAWHVIYINPLPIAKFTSSNHCTGQTVSYNSSSAISSGSIIYTHWDLGNGDTASGTSAGGVYAQADSFEVGIRVRSDKGCESEKIQWVNINETPDASFTFINPTSRNIVFDVTATKLSKATYSWTFGDSRSDTGYFMSHNYTADGEYHAVLEIDNLGCTDTSGKDIMINTTSVNHSERLPKVNAYPSPFESTISVQYVLDMPENVTLSVYDFGGNLVQQLNHHGLESGEHVHLLELNICSGVYLLEIKAGHKTNRQLIVHK